MPRSCDSTFLGAPGFGAAVLYLTLVRNRYLMKENKPKCIQTHILFLFFRNLRSSRTFNKAIAFKVGKNLMYNPEINYSIINH